MNRQNGLVRRDLLKGAAAVSAGLAWQRWQPVAAQDASPTVEPEEVTAREAVEGKLNITWWSHNNIAFVDANLEMIDRFQAENPDINIVYQYFPYDIFISKLQAGYNSGTVADIQQMFGTWVTQYSGFGLLDPVPANLSEGMADRFFEAAIGAYGRDGQFYGMPKEYNLENGSMLVNPALLEEAGVTDPPATWQELMDNAVAATKYDDQDRITQAGFLMAGRDAITFLFLAMILQQGATYWADDGVHVNFQTEAAQKAWQAETEIVTKYRVESQTSLPDQNRYVVFFQGKGAMCMVGPWAIAVGQTDYPDLEFDYVNMPTFAGDEYRFAAESGWGEVVNANAPAENKEAAWRFIDFMSQPENARDWNLATYTIPSVKALLDDPAILEAAPLLQASFNVLPYGQWIGAVQDRDRFFISLENAFTAVALGQMDAPSALLQAEQEINQMIDEVAGP
jgi:multiple sugar transport system substrate-binding protein